MTIFPVLNIFQSNGVDEFAFKITFLELFTWSLGAKQKLREAFISGVARVFAARCGLKILLPSIFQ